MTINSLYQSQTILVNGVVMDLKAYKAMCKARSNKKSKRTKKSVSGIKAIPNEIKGMLKSIKVLKSLSAYYFNSYKQWGRIATTLINLPLIKSPFIQFNAKSKEVEKTIADIEMISKKGEKAVYQYIEKLAWQIEDMATYISLLASGVRQSDVMFGFRGHECIEGRGRRLGIRVLVERSSKAIKELGEMVYVLKRIANDGADVFEYDETRKGA